MDLRISRGIRKPCYSTSLPFLTMSSAIESPDEEHSHAAPVVAVESLNPFPTHPLVPMSGSGAAAVVSQFVTVDEAGLVIFWVTAEKGLTFFDAGKFDNNLSRWLFHVYLMLHSGARRSSGRCTKGTLGWSRSCSDSSDPHAQPRLVPKCWCIF